MKYRSIKHATFLARPNRFIARVLLDGAVETVHVKNTGRCRELLQPGVAVILEEAGHPGRKTRYSLVAVYKGKMLINIDSQAPNTVVYEAIQQRRLPEFGVVTRLTREVRYRGSRFDLYYETEEKRGFIEVKGVTLEEQGLALFPDAPTERGTKHLRELTAAVREGYEGCVFFLLQMKGPQHFQPNKAVDPDFAEALQVAKESGVRVLAYDSIVTEDGIALEEPTPVEVCPDPDDPDPDYK